MTLRVDSDRNPYNHNDLAILSTQTVAAATGGHYAQNTVEWDTRSLPVGTPVYVYAQVTDGARTRYCYALPSLRGVAVSKPQPAIVGTRR